MLLSMTGFGDAHGHIQGLGVSLEIRSVNHKGLKTSFRLPDALAGLEPELEALLRGRVVRGSVVVSVRLHAEGPQGAGRINPQALEAALAALAPYRTAGTTVDLAGLLALPGVVERAEAHEGFTDAARPVALELLERAVGKFLDMRRTEGTALVRDLTAQLDAMQAEHTRIGARAPASVQEYHAKLRARVQALLNGAEAKVDEATLLREVAVYADRCDISEELTRLASHMGQFRAVLGRAAPPEGAGRKLDFLAQEMLREANTIGSKGADADIALAVIELKTRIDRIKEQVANIE